MTTETRTQHTQWPKFRVVRVPNATYPDIATYQIMGEWEPSGQDAVWGETDNDPETAKLFAVAPALLAALEAALQHGNGGIMHQEPCGWKAQALAAIAAATA